MRWSMTRFQVKQDRNEDSIWHIVDSQGNIHASFDSKFEAEHDLRVYYKE